MEQEIELTAEDLWNDVSTRLREALNDTTYSTWFGEVDGEELDGDRFVLAVPNDFTRDWIEGHFLDLIRATVRDVAGGERQVGFRVIETAPPQPSVQAIPATVTPLPLEVTQRSEIAGINPKYTFDSFVIGSS
ncbi:MAG TPA: DnaA N-terminal domain-containing protein, partial [Gaiellaceae bacterium]|nr:DnaA N-terminal domain-containing protein [Gaiellaceae bacterium]